MLINLSEGSDSAVFRDSKFRLCIKQSRLSSAWFIRQSRACSSQKSVRLQRKRLRSLLTGKSERQVALVAHKLHYEEEPQSLLYKLIIETPENEYSAAQWHAKAN